MNFRTKIWTLPLSATGVFVIGIALCVLLGARISSGLAALQGADSPHLEELAHIERHIDGFRQSLQTAAAEGDDSRLKDAEAQAAEARKAVAAIAKLDGRSEVARELEASLTQHTSTALDAIGGMLKKAEMGDRVARMQAAQGAFDKVMKAQLEQARARIDERYATLGGTVKASIAVTVLTGLVALLVLGFVSWVIVKSVWRDLGGEPTRLRELVSKVAEGDLEVQVPVEPGDTRSLNAAMAGMVQRLRGTVRSIREATDSIATASNEIAAGNLDLSTRTENTASNLQQTASSMEELTGTVRQSAEAAQQANQLAASAGSAAQRGGDIVSNVVSNMEEINAASRKINEIIGVIDGIAFQTNILALNAAVEAARAGEQGRGFAVVAAEVRSLAQRSAQAAKEIKTLISASSEKVESGARLVQDAGTAMQEIVSGVQRFTDIIGEISAATAEQAKGIDTVNQSVNHLDQMTQQNAALVEESAASAGSLKDQAARLAQAVSVFRVERAASDSRSGARAPATPSTSASDAPASSSSASKPSAASSHASALFSSFAAPAASSPAPAHVAPVAKPAAPAASTKPAAAPAPVVKPAPAPAPAPAMAAAASKAPSDDWETF
jgi:methyl-accepting chemotaxis protein